MNTSYYETKSLKVTEPKGSYGIGCLVTAYEAFYYDLKVTAA